MISPLTHDDPAGFGPYRLLGRLGSGGMGTVYLARSATGRTAALKTVHAATAGDATLRARFRLETDAARVIGERHGAAVFDADPLADIPWLATEYVLGPPLDSAVALNGPLPEASVRALGAALAGALAQLHSSEVVHRDLKPSNVMVTAYGPKIIDFGIARAAGDSGLTRTGTAAGTPAFMSPEQATGQEHAPAGDVFALAGVLVFALTGHGPFGSGQPADLLYRVRYSEPDLTGVPASLVPLIGACLSKDPAGRPSTVQLAGALHDGHGDFADHLPDPLLAEIARRASEVWLYEPFRLPAPGHATASPITSGSERSGDERSGGGRSGGGRSVGGRSGPSRRKLLTVGGGSLLGVAAAGAGAWAWWGPAGTGQAKGGPGAGPSPKASRKSEPDYLWQLQVSDPPSDLWPAAASIPFPIGDLIALITGAGLATAHAADGAASWGPTQIDSAWQVGTDGKDLYRVTQLDKYQGHMGDDWPLILETVDLATGKPKRRLPEMSEFNGVIFENQLLCVADQVIYLAVGQGKNDQDGFQHDQPWFLAAVDARTAKKLWSTPLPARPEKSERLHFLDARVVANRLILLQETADGAVRANARDRRTGRLLWDKPLPGIKPDAVRSMMTTDDRHLYLGLGALRALRLSDGGEAWNLSKARPGSSFGPPAVKDGVVYAVQKGRGVVGVDAGDGAVRWEEKGGGDDPKADLTDRPVLGTTYLYSRSPSGLRAIDLASRATARTYRTTGTRFVAHREAEVVIALGGFFLAAFPLQ